MSKEKIYIFQNNEWEEIEITKIPNSIKYTITFISDDNQLNEIFNSKLIMFNNNEHLIFHGKYITEENLAKRIINSSIIILYCEKLIERIYIIKKIEDLLFYHQKTNEIYFKILTKFLPKNFSSLHCFDINELNINKFLEDDEKLKEIKPVPINELNIIEAYIDVIFFKPKFSLFLNKEEKEIKISISNSFYEDENEGCVVKFEKKILYPRIFDYFILIKGERIIRKHFDYSNIDQKDFQISFSLPFSTFGKNIISKFKEIKREELKKEGTIEITFKGFKTS